MTVAAWIMVAVTLLGEWLRRREVRRRVADLKKIEKAAAASYGMKVRAVEYDLWRIPVGATLASDDGKTVGRVRLDGKEV